MSDRTQRIRHSVDLQAEVFRLAEAEHGLTLTVLARTRGIPRPTLRDWRNGTQMPVWAIGELRLPDDLTSLLLAPWNKHVGTDETDDSDLDALGREAAGFVADKLEREADGKVCHIDKAALKNRARRIASAARAAAAA